MMNKRQWLKALVFSCVATILAANSATVEASGGKDVRRFANMSVGATKAKVKYEEIKNNSRRKISFEFERVPAGTALSVFAGNRLIGSATANNLGRGKFELDTRLGHNVPQLPAGTLIEVKRNGVTVMSGVLR